VIVLTTLEFAPDEAPGKIADEVRSVFRASKGDPHQGSQAGGDLRDYYGRLF
jgi:hypothetical protein